MYADAKRTGSVRRLAGYLAKSGARVHDIANLFAAEDDLPETGDVEGIRRYLMRAFDEMAFAATTSRSKKPFLHIWISVGQEDVDGPRLAAFARSAIRTLGFNMRDNPFVIVEHNDTDHRHVHIIISLVQLSTGTIYDLKFERKKLVAFAAHRNRRFGYTEKANGELFDYTPAQSYAASLIGRSAPDVLRAINDAWRYSEDTEELNQRLSRQGLTLARGDRAIVAVDWCGFPWTMREGRKTRPNLAARIEAMELPRYGDLRDRRRITKTVDALVDGIAVKTAGIDRDIAATQRELEALTVPDRPTKNVAVQTVLRGSTEGRELADLRIRLENTPTFWAAPWGRKIRCLLDRLKLPKKIEQAEVRYEDLERRLWSTEDPRARAWFNDGARQYDAVVQRRTELENRLDDLRRNKRSWTRLMGVAGALSKFDPRCVVRAPYDASIGQLTRILEFHLRAAQTEAYREALSPIEWHGRGDAMAEMEAVVESLQAGDKMLER